MKANTRCRGDEGTAIVEAALALPVVLTIVLGGLDFGITELRYSTFASAAKDGARAAILKFPQTNTTWTYNGGTCSGIGNTTLSTACQAVRRRLAGLPFTQVAISCYQYPIQTLTTTISCGGSTGAKAGNVVEVKVTWITKPVSPVGKTFLGTKTVISKSRMVIQ